MTKVKKIYPNDCPFVNCLTASGLANLMQFYYDNYGKKLELPDDGSKPVVIGNMIESTEEIDKIIRRKPWHLARVK